MKKCLALLVIVILTGLVPAIAAAKAVASQDQTEKIETFKGKVVSTKQKGSMAKPYIAVGVAGEDGKEVVFNLRNNTELTDVDGKSLRSMGSVKKGRTVEVKYAVKDGQNEATSIHYLD
jgi:outer membrane lipoprotein-sorting protein